MEQVLIAHTKQRSKKPNFWMRLYCHLFGHTSQKAIIEDEQFVTRYICKHCHRRLGNGLRKSLPVPQGIDPIIWQNYLHELIESYKRYEGISKGNRSRKRDHSLDQ